MAKRSKSNSGRGKKRVGKPVLKTVTAEVLSLTFTPSTLNVERSEANATTGSVGRDQDACATVISKGDLAANKENVEPLEDTTHPVEQPANKKRPKVVRLPKAPIRRSARLNPGATSLPVNTVPLPEVTPSTTTCVVEETSKEGPVRGSKTEPKARGNKRKRGALVDAIEPAAEEVQPKRVRVVEEPIIERQFEESAMRTDLSEAGEPFSLEDILSSVPRPRPVASSAKAPPVPVAKSTFPLDDKGPSSTDQTPSEPLRHNAKAPCRGLQQPCPTCPFEPLPEFATMAEIHPTKRSKKKGKASKKQEEEAWVDPRSYCRILSTRYFYCPLCEVDFDFRHDTTVPEYDTTAYDKHARTRAHRTLFLTAGSAGPPVVRTSIPKAGELPTTGSVLAADGRRKSARTITTQKKHALSNVAGHEFALEVEETFFKCALCKLDIILSADPLSTNTKPWTDHIATEGHQAKERAFSGQSTG